MNPSEILNVSENPFCHFMAPDFGITLLWLQVFGLQPVFNKKRDEYMKLNITGRLCWKRGVRLYREGDTSVGSP
jgi:hypothetical protein